MYAELRRNRAGRAVAVSVVLLVAILIFAGQIAVGEAAADNKLRRERRTTALETTSKPPPDPHAAAINIAVNDNPQTLVDNLVVAGTGITITSVTYTGAESAVGLFAGGPMDIADGIIMASGNVLNALPPNIDTVKVSTDFELPGCPECELLVNPEDTTYDAARLEILFDVAPGVTRVTFDFIFGSEEYPEYVNSAFNDVFGAFLNGEQIAYDESGAPITINGPFFNNPELVQTPPGNGLDYDGSTPRLRTCAVVLEESTDNRLVLAICDTGDRILDSGVLLARLRGTMFANCEGTGIAPDFVTPTPAQGTTYSVTAGDSVVFDIRAQDVGPNNDQVTVTVENLPSGAEMSPTLPLTSNPVNSRFSWETTISDTGLHPVTFVAQDLELLTDERTINIVVTDPNVPPYFVTEFSDTTITEGDQFSLTVEAGDVDLDDILHLSCPVRPEGAGFTDYGDGTGLFTFVPDYMHVDLDHIVRFEVTDGTETMRSDSFVVSVENRQLMVDVSGSTPPPPYPDFLITGPISVYFNEPVDSASLIDNVTPDSKYDNFVPIISWVAGQPFFRVHSPSGYFRPLDTIAVEIRQDVMDLAGYRLGVTQTVYLPTGPAIYPGDTDNNGVVDERDILPLGIFWNQTGPGRPGGQGLTWEVKGAHAWDPLRATYADADGNGRVEALDVCGITENWSQISSLVSADRDGPAFSAADRFPPEMAAQIYAALIDCPTESPAKERLREIFAAMLQADAAEQLPGEFELYQNYPNPFNPETMIRFYLPEAGQVRLSVFNIVGQRVAVLIDRHLEQGYGEAVWDGTDDHGRAVSSGIYLYRLETKQGSVSRRMTLLK